MTGFTCRITGPPLPFEDAEPYAAGLSFAPVPMTQPMSTVTFMLESDYVELNQLLKLCGACESGGAGKILVAEGRVSVDGRTESRKTAKIRAGQVVNCEDLRIRVIAGSP